MLLNILADEVHRAHQRCLQVRGVGREVVRAPALPASESEGGRS